MLYISHIALAAGFFGKWCHCKRDWHFTFHSHSFYVEMAAKHIKKTAMNLEKEAAWKRQTKREREMGIKTCLFLISCWYFEWNFSYFFFSICMFHSISLVSWASLKKKTVLCIYPINTHTHKHIHYYELHWNRCAALSFQSWPSARATFPTKRERDEFSSRSASS